jgi:hypothetical protein
MYENWTLAGRLAGDAVDRPDWPRLGMIRVIAFNGESLQEQLVDLQSRTALASTYADDSCHDRR